MFPKQENLYRWYLLGATSSEEDKQIEQWSRDPENKESLLLAEEDLIDDYACGTLPADEQELFEQNFLTTLERRQKLQMAQAAIRYAARQKVQKGIVAPSLIAKEEGGEALLPDRPDPFATDREGRQRDWWRVLFEPGWKIIAYAVLVLGLVWGGWRIWRGESKVEKGLVALHKAYLRERPLEPRLTGFTYAPYSVTLGPEDRKADYRMRDLAEKTLLEAVQDDPSPGADHALGQAYLARKEIDKAIEQFELALKANTNNAQFHSDLGVALFEKGKLERMDGPAGKSEVTLAESLKHFNRALELNPSLQETRFNRALLYQALRLWPSAQEDWEAYLKQDASSAWGEEARRNLEMIKKQEKKISQNKEQLFQDFLQAWRTGDDEGAWQAVRRSFFRTGNHIGEKLVDDFLSRALKGQITEAQEQLSALRFAGSVAKRKTSESLMAVIARGYQTAPPEQYRKLSRAHQLMKQAHESLAQTDIPRAEDAYTQAIRIFDQTGMVGELLLAKIWLGTCYYTQNNYLQAAQLYTEVADESEAREFLWLKSMAFNGLALAYSRNQEYSTAIDYSRRSRQLAEKLTDENGQLRGIIVLAGLYRSVGRYEECLWAAREGLDLAARIAADASQVSGLYFNAALGFSALRLYDAALAYQQETVRLAQQTGNTLALSRYYVHLGLLYGKLNNHDAAIANILRGMKYGQNLKETDAGRDMVSYALLNLGHVHRAAGNFDEAMAAFSQVIEYSSKKDEALMRHWANKGRLLTYIRQEDLVAARNELQQTLSWIESRREKIIEESNRANYFDAEQDVYDIAVDLALLEKDGERRAFDYTEQSRARSLLDARSGGYRPGDVNVTTEPRLANIVQPLKLDEIQRRMPDCVQLLSYASLEKKLVIWLITRNDRVKYQVVDVTEQELARLVNIYVEQISGLPKAQQVMAPQAGIDLYDFLIRPVESSLDNKKLLCIVPDKTLHSLPFGAILPSADGKYLLETFALFYASSANMFLRASETARLKAGNKTERLLSVGNPRFERERFPELEDLPYASMEATEIASYYPADPRVLIERQARKDAIVAEMERSDVVHFALHHIPDQKFPLRSRLVLAATENGARTLEREDVLLAQELYRLDLSRPRLIVLSSCQTRIGAYYGGEGVISFSRPLEAAGIPLIVASLWKVNSPATTRLMTCFHQARKREGLPTVTALRAAQIQMLSQAEGVYRHPYYWASFVVIGGYSEF